MSIDFLCHFLLLCTAINYAVLGVWFLTFAFAHSWLRKLHGKWFNLSDETFDGIHYGGMAVYKLAIVLFNVAPVIALYVAQKCI